MKTNLQRLIPWTGIACVMFLCATVSAAEFTVEPYLGYSAFQFKDGSYLTETQNGINLGARGGWFLGRNLYLALDYHHAGGFEMKYSTYLLHNTAFGGGAGYFLGAFRVFAGYYFLDRIEDPDQNISWTGSGYKFVIGIPFRQRVFLNVEFMQHNATRRMYSSYEDTAFNKNDFSSAMTMVSLSALIELFGI